MLESAQKTTLADQLRKRDATLWRQVESSVLPHVLAALRSRYGPGRHWQDLEACARSAQRVAWDLLATGENPTLERLETLAQFEAWLVRVAARKFSNALRRAAREADHAYDVQLVENQALLESLSRQSAADVVAELETHLRDETDRIVFRGKLEEKTEAEIARQLGCSQRKVRNVWQRIRKRLAHGKDEG
jgi:RNA polymerase sigma factor (sigma-70 family)